MTPSDYSARFAITRKHQQAARDAVAQWAMQHAPDAKMKDMAHLMKSIENAVEVGEGRSR